MLNLVYNVRNKRGPRKVRVSGNPLLWYIIELKKEKIKNKKEDKAKR